MSQLFRNMNKDEDFIDRFWRWFDTLPRNQKEYYWYHTDMSAAEEMFLYKYHIDRMKSKK